MIKADVYGYADVYETVPPVAFLADILKFVDPDSVVAYAFVVEDEIVAVGGFQPRHPNNGEGFLFISPELYKHPYVFVQMREVWKEKTKDLGRIEAQVNIRQPADINFAYSLGMLPEGIRRKAGPRREDYIIFARVQ